MSDNEYDNDPSSSGVGIDDDGDDDDSRSFDSRDPSQRSQSRREEDDNDPSQSQRSESNREEDQDPSGRSESYRRDDDDPSGQSYSRGEGEGDNDPSGRSHSTRSASRREEDPSERSDQSRGNDPSTQSVSQREDDDPSASKGDDTPTSPRQEEVQQVQPDPSRELDELLSDPEARQNEPPADPPKVADAVKGIASGEVNTSAKKPAAPSRSYSHEEEEADKEKATPKLDEKLPSKYGAALMRATTVETVPPQSQEGTSDAQSVPEAAAVPPTVSRTTAKKPTATFVAADSLLRSDQFEDNPDKEFSTGPPFLGRNETAVTVDLNSQPFSQAGTTSSSPGEPEIPPFGGGEQGQQDAPIPAAFSAARTVASSPGRPSGQHHMTDLDSLDGRSLGSGRASRSNTQKTSLESRRMAAPGRPPKFATRPTHVAIRQADFEVDSSLRGVVEGTKTYYRKNQQTKIVGPDLSVTGIDKSYHKKTPFQNHMLCALYVMLAIVFFGGGTYIALFAGAGGTSSGASFRTGSPSPSYGQRSGEGTDAFLTNHGVIEMSRHDRDGEETVHISNNVHVSQESDQDIEQRIQELGAIILQHQVSLPETLNITDPMTPQFKAVKWLAESDALDTSEEDRDVQHEMLLQRYALAVFYYSLGGDVVAGDDTPTEHDIHSVHVLSPEDPYVYQGWYRKAKWMSQLSICTWFGITCDNDEMVEKLNLTKNGLKGELPMFELFQALRTTLKVFDISHNGHITGDISLPEEVEIEPWLQLEYFFVNDNALTNSVPSFSWFRDSPVKGINFAWNKFAGELPDIADLEHLKMLYVSHNQLGGALPRSISNLTKLEELYINNNNFVGELPREWFELTSVVELDARYNNFSGNIPLVLPLMSNLKILRLGDCGLSGPLPDFLDSLSNLRELDLSNNTLSGILPARSLGSLAEMEKLYLQNNTFSGSIPSDVAAMTKLETLLLQDNDLYGSIPIDLCRLKAGFFNFNRLNDLEADCEHQVICDCCDKCY